MGWGYVLALRPRSAPSSCKGGAGAGAGEERGLTLARGRRRLLERGEREREREVLSHCPSETSLSHPPRMTLGHRESVRRAGMRAR
jgi:hypothetical protein